MLIQQMIHCHNETNTKGGMLFVDFFHAYDYISQEYIIRIQVLNTMNFPANFINLVTTLMKDQKGRVLVNVYLSPEFEVNSGGKQGGPLFPLIYIIALFGRRDCLARARSERQGYYTALWRYETVI